MTPRLDLITTNQFCYVISLTQQRIWLTFLKLPANKTFAFPDNVLHCFFCLTNKETSFLLYSPFTSCVVTDVNKYFYLKMENCSSLPRLHFLLLKTHLCIPKRKKKMKVHYNSQKYNKSYSVLFIYYF